MRYVHTCVFQVRTIALFAFGAGRMQKFAQNPTQQQQCDSFMNTLYNLCAI